MISLYVHADAYDGAGDGTPVSLEYWIGLGYDVLTSHMTARGENVSPFGHLVSWQRHDSTKIYEASFNPREWFLAPTIRAMNHLDSVYNYDNIYMMGISGGGWATTIISAIDTRIEKSFAVAGTYPHFVRDDPGGSSQSSGDYEQGHSATRSTPFLIDHFRDTVSYLDMYALCGWQREHWQILNEDDDCCFDGLYWKVYVPEMRRRFFNFSSGSYNFYQYSDPSQHRINEEVLNLIQSKL
jgi:hypothetical protein